MSEGLLARARRVVEAGVGSVVETAERLSGPALMRQAVRDAEHAVDDARRQQRRAEGRAAQAEERAKLADGRAAGLGDEARYALTIGREDLAAAAIARKQTVEGDAATARDQQQAAREAEARLDGTIAELAERQRALADELLAYEKAALQSKPPVRGGRIARAEESFARALSAVGGVELADRAGVDPLGELAAARRDQAVADELARLKAEVAAPPRRTRKA